MAQCVKMLAATPDNLWIPYGRENRLPHVCHGMLVHKVKRKKTKTKSKTQVPSANLFPAFLTAVYVLFHLLFPQHFNHIEMNNPLISLIKTLNLAQLSVHLQCWFS